MRSLNIMDTLMIYIIIKQGYFLIIKENTFYLRKEYEEDFQE